MISRAGCVKNLATPLPRLVGEVTKAWQAWQSVAKKRESEFMSSTNEISTKRGKRGKAWQNENVLLPQARQAPLPL